VIDKKINQKIERLRQLVLERDSDLDQIALEDREEALSRKACKEEVQLPKEKFLLQYLSTLIF